MTENKQSKIEKITDILKAGVESVFESDAYKNYLEFIGKFRHYSWANTMLIMLQAPETRYVASQTDWREKFGRTLKIGAWSQKILIFAPHTREETDENGNVRITVGFHAATVFPIEATTPLGDNGEDIPELCRPLCADVDHFERLRDVLIDISPVPVTFEDIPGDALGFYEKGVRIVVQSGLSEVQTIKTLMHEIAHSWLHCKGGECEKSSSRAEMETVAESIAYSVLYWLDDGFDSASYSWPYLASWAKDRSLPELRRSLSVIQRTAVKMMDMIERRLEDELHQGTAADAC